MNSFYSKPELADLGLGAYGEDVFISRKSSLYSPQNIFAGSHVRIDDFTVITAGNGRIEIGNYVHIACFCVLYGASGIVLGDFTGLSARSTLYSESDDFSGESLCFPFFPKEYKAGYLRGRITLEKHAIIGASSTVLPGVTLFEGAAVGAHSLVIKPCERWTIYAGVPARAIRARSRTMFTLISNYMKASLVEQC